MSGKTEWDDLQIKLGNMKAPPKQLTEDELFDLIQEAAQYSAQQEKKEKLENASLEDLKEMEDDEDEKVLEELRKKRIAQMKLDKERNKFGELYHISEPEYKSQVTETKDVHVVVHLFKNGIPQCQLLNQHLDLLAKKFKATKFVKIRSEEAIHNYPDRNLPTILVYKNGDIVGQLITLQLTGGDSTTAKDIEWHLSKMGVVDTDLTENPKITQQTKKAKSTSARSFSNARVDSDDDYSDEDSD
ncbi:phosducin-like protein [Tieghemostelium lacteum]|uniref:Phosducin-like protein n=1 Tax=Tieghemostelium lacteum TaxID=361077 RepID=A0A151ZK11_TIELA|nr:phosducin-like protein [Tieghemostelium lacteum]|eukprot:KYQ94267.1 phosducin-like protein [Tieghemostelium lacteum]